MSASEIIKTINQQEVEIKQQAAGIINETISTLDGSRSTYWIQNHATDRMGGLCMGQAMQTAHERLYQGTRRARAYATAVHAVEHVMLERLSDRDRHLQSLSLTTGRPHISIPHWNDFTGRTADEVIEVLKLSRENLLLEAEALASRP